MHNDTDHLRAGIEQLELDRHGIALEHFTVAADEAASHQERRAAVAYAAQINLTLERSYEAIAWAERLRAESPTPDEANLLEASAWVQLGDGARALELLDAGVENASSDHTAYPAALVHQLRAQAYGFDGQPDAALTEAFAALLTEWALPEIWRSLATLAAQHDVELAEAVGRIPDDGVMQVLGWLLDMPAAGADAIVELLWQRQPGDRRVLAFVTSLGNRLPLERAMEWSARLRAAGLAQDCAVLGIAASEDRAPRERVRAAAIAGAAFGDERALPVLEVATVALPDDQLAGAFAELLELAPEDLLDGFVVAAATTARRALLVAAELLDRGATDAAVALTRHAVEQTTGQPEALRSAVAAALDGQRLQHLARELQERGAADVATLVQA